MIDFVALGSGRIQTGASVDGPRRGVVLDGPGFSGQRASPKPAVLENPPDDFFLPGLDETDHPHRTTALGAFQRINFPHPLDQRCPTAGLAAAGSVGLGCFQQLSFDRDFVGGLRATPPNRSRLAGLGNGRHSGFSAR